VLERVDEALQFSTAGGGFRAQVDGTVDLEGYWFDQPPPGLLQADGQSLLTSRLTLFLDAQLGPQVYAFAQARWDEGFDPGDDNGGLRVDEWALRFTPWEDGRLNIQAGQFATVFGNWTPRHGSWENPFVNAPLPYENLTGIWDVAAARSVDTLLRWSHVDPVVTGEAETADKDLRVPVIWGPSYASGSGDRATRAGWRSRARSGASATRWRSRTPRSLPARRPGTWGSPVGSTRP
jgi:hypothetical protein